MTSPIATLGIEISPSSATVATSSDGVTISVAHRATDIVLSDAGATIETIESSPSIQIIV